MSNIVEKIDSLLKEQMKAHAEAAVSTLRMLKSALKNKEIELRRELKEEEVIKTLQGQVKSRKDSVEQFQKAGREDLVEKETAEIELIEQFLPAALSAQELDKLVKEAIAESGAQSPADMGKVMPLAMQKVKGQASGDAVKAKVLELL